MKLRMKRRVVCKLLALLGFEQGRGELYRLRLFANNMHSHYSFIRVVMLCDLDMINRVTKCRDPYKVGYYKAPSGSQAF
jgi:hypothetical protein